MATGTVRVGVGGWTFEPWRDNFYPKGLTQSRELEYASRQLTAIEINGTYYGTQKRDSFAKWRDETPPGFVFSMKASRYATNRRVLAEAGASIDRFCASGIAELGDKLGPVVWQFMPTKRYEAEDFEAFLKLLPREAEGRPLRHVVDVRHDSFRCEAFVDLARRHRVATVFTDSADYPSFADPTADFIYARLMRAELSIETGYAPEALDTIAATARAWAEGGRPANLPYATESAGPATGARDVYLYFINGAKERAPAAAKALLATLGAAG